MIESQPGIGIFAFRPPKNPTSQKSLKKFQHCINIISCCNCFHANGAQINEGQEIEDVKDLNSFPRLFANEYS